MKINLIIAVLITAAGCASEGIKTFDRAEALTGETALRLKKEVHPELILKELKAPTGGYYYILDSEGRVKYHPEKGLTGSDFSRFDFVKKMLAEKNGCIRSEAGNGSRIVIFRETPGGDILCYTIHAGKITGAEACETYKENRQEEDE